MKNSIAISSDIKLQVKGPKENLTQLALTSSVGIALSGTIGIGLFINSGELLGLSGSVGIILSYFFGGLIAMAVMMCLAEMVSVRPVPGAIFEYPMLYVDPALGYAVGFAYWFVL